MYVAQAVTLSSMSTLLNFWYVCTTHRNRVGEECLGLVFKYSVYMGRINLCWKVYMWLFLV